MKAPRIRSRWTGVCNTHSFFGTRGRDAVVPVDERWAVYVVEVPNAGIRCDYVVVGRLLQRPWSRVGGKRVFGSLGAAREDGQRMANNLCPRAQSQRQDLTEPVRRPA